MVPEVIRVADTQQPTLEAGIGDIQLRALDQSTGKVSKCGLKMSTT
jgi:hypothetical protein